MALDPTDRRLETPDPELAEELEDNDTTTEIDVEAPENDVAEQHADIAPQDRDDPLENLDPARANEADLIEQARVVSLDEDDYL
ncbi:hypothetical protein [Streptomyces sp. NPDC046197]|uniref:hypothetical protein n=1 Tax=Streptomyces sp. NPDC046197 TaxID=3154337 RepID=UPI003408A28C